MDDNSNFLELLKKRYSCRKYIPSRKVEMEKIISCLEAARLAPSASNSQPWKYIIVDDKSLKRQVVENLKIGPVKFNQFAQDASFFAIVVQQLRNLESSAGQVVMHRSFSQFDIGCSVNNFCLRATELGLGTCIMGIFDEKKLKKIFNIPLNRKIIVVVSAGYPEDVVSEKKRKALDEIYSLNKW